MSTIGAVGCPPSSSPSPGSAASSAAARCAGGSGSVEEVEATLGPSCFSVRSGGLLMIHRFGWRRRPGRLRFAHEVFGMRDAEAPIGATRLAAGVVLAAAIGIDAARRVALMRAACAAERARCIGDDGPRLAPLRHVSGAGVWRGA